jgi:hypothetical protein
MIRTGIEMKPKVNRAAMILRIFCAMVFLSLGFGHRMPTVVAADSLSLAYSLPDGSFAALCSADYGKMHDKPSGDCEACRLAGSVLLPPPADHAWLLTSFASLGALQPLHGAVSSAYGVDRPRLRGPPLSA